MVPQIGETLARGYQIGSPFEDGRLTPAPACGMVGALLNYRQCPRRCFKTTRVLPGIMLGFLFSGIEFRSIPVPSHILPG